MVVAECSGTVAVQSGVGSTGTGGAGGVPVSTSSASVGGAGGAGGSGGSGGGSVAASIVEACVIASSCGKLAGWEYFTASVCVDAFARLSWDYDGPEGLPDPELAARLLACATSADCSAVRACFGGDWIDVSRCREGALCQGNSLTASGASFDCGTLGATCDDLWSNAIRACCNSAPCP